MIIASANVKHVSASPSTAAHIILQTYKGGWVLQYFRPFGGGTRMYNCMPGKLVTRSMYGRSDE